MLGPLGATALLALLDWAAWEWAISMNHPTIGLIAGLFMAPIAVGFAWSLCRVAIALAQQSVRRATAPRELAPRERAPRERVPPAPVERTPSAPFDIHAQDERVAA
jgi:hypothetical protein